MRTVLLILATAAAYLLLRGWPDSWSVTLRIAVAGTLLLAALLVWGKSAPSPPKPVRPTSRSKLIDFVAPIVIVLLIESLFLTFLAVAPQKSEDLAGSFQKIMLFGPDDDDSRSSSGALPSIIEPDGRGGPGSGRTITSNWLFSGPGPRRMNKNREVSPSNRPEVYLYPESATEARSFLSQPRFLRNFTLSSYRDGTWYPLPIVPDTLDAQNGRITRSSSTPGRPLTYEISHLANLGQPTLAVTVPAFISLDLPSVREIAPDTFRLPPPPAGQKSYRYRATSVPFDLSGVTTILPGESPAPEYLALPPDPDLQDRLRTLAASFGPLSRRSLDALHDYLDTQFQYTLSPTLPEDADPIESFLFETKSGYCTHFASATVMLARAMGLPARLAFGWSGGRYFETPNFFVFRAREAHTWAEIYLRDYGWVIFETTPSSRNEGSASIAPPEEAPPFPDDASPPAESETSSPSDLASLLRLSCWTGGLALFTLLLGLVLKKRSLPKSFALSSQSNLPEEPHYLAIFRQTCLALGHPMPPGRTLRDHLDRMPTTPLTRDLLAYHYGVQYADQPPDRARERQLVRQLRAWCKDASS